MGYSKLFAEIVASTIWQESSATKVVWVTMLAIKDRWHKVNASIPGLAKLSGVTLEECETALKILESNDPYSRSKEYQGRRIESCDGGWLVLNGEKYRNKMSLDERREYNRIKQKQYYHKAKIPKKPVQKSVQPSTNLEGISSTCTHTDSDTDSDADTDTKKEKRVSIKRQTFDQFWDAHPRKIGKKKAFQIWQRLDTENGQFDKIMAALAQQKKTEQWQRDGGRYIPHPATWLNQERFNDEVAVAKTWQEIFMEKNHD